MKHAYIIIGVIIFLLLGCGNKDKRIEEALGNLESSVSQMEGEIMQVCQDAVDKAELTDDPEELREIISDLKNVVEFRIIDSPWSCYIEDIDSELYEFYE